jgi:hypothetical protein
LGGVDHKSWHSTEYGYSWAVLSWTGTVFSIDSVDSRFWFSICSTVLLDFSIVFFFLLSQGSFKNNFGWNYWRSGLFFYPTTLSLVNNQKHFKQSATRQFVSKKHLPSDISSFLITSLSLIRIRSANLDCVEARKRKKQKIYKKHRSRSHGVENVLDLIFSWWQDTGDLCCWFCSFEWIGWSRTSTTTLLINK